MKMDYQRMSYLQIQQRLFGVKFQQTHLLYTPLMKMIIQDLYKMLDWMD